MVLGFLNTKNHPFEIRQRAGFRRGGIKWDESLAGIFSITESRYVAAGKNLPILSALGGYSKQHRPWTIAPITGFDGPALGNTLYRPRGFFLFVRSSPQFGRPLCRQR